MRKVLTSLFLLIAAFASSLAQEFETPLYRNVELSENVIHTSLLKNSPIYPITIAEKNKIFRDTLNYKDSIDIADTIRLPKIIYSKDTSITRIIDKPFVYVEINFRKFDTVSLQRTTKVIYKETSLLEQIIKPDTLLWIDTINFSIHIKSTNTYTSSVMTIVLTDSIINDTTIFSNFNISRLDDIPFDFVDISDTTSFFDDFSFSSVYPNEYLWATRQTYINNNYAIDPISIGTATFDALDEKGILYENKSTLFTADTLKSNTIRFGQSDSVVLSFYIQPGGLGDMPEKSDKLILEFFNPDSAQYYRIWQSTDTLYSRKYGKFIKYDSLVNEFSHIIIPIDSIYLRDGFRFRFINYISYSSAAASPGGVGNCDHWNLDYVYMAANRTIEDTLLNDVTINHPGRSILSRYESMPYSHFKNSNILVKEIANKLMLGIRNNDIIDRNVSYRFMADNALLSDYRAEVLPQGSYLFSEIDRDLPLSLVDADTHTFFIKSELKNEGEDEFSTINDSYTYRQVFDNYFAYDDGSAESGYSISGLGTEGAMVAYQFVTQLPDTLRAIDMFFNQLDKGANKELYFELTVWNNSGGAPGEVLYPTKRDSETKPFFKEGVNKFYRYHITDVPLIVQDTFYIGWVQVKNLPMSIGFDKNRINNHKIFYNISGQDWQSSALKGSLMMRPVVGKVLPVHLPNQITTPVFSVYPNPAYDILHIAPPQDYMDQIISYSIFDMQGRLIMRGNNILTEIEVTSFSNGLYFIRIEKDGQLLATQKFIVNH